MHFKLSNLNSNLALTLGYLNPALNNSALMFRLKGTSTKSVVLWRNKKGSKRKLYMGYVCSDTFWALNTKVCFKKGACVSLSLLEDSDLWVDGGPAHRDPNFSKTCGLQFELKIGNLSNDDSDGHENGQKAIGLDWQNKNLCTCITFFCTFLCRRCTTTTRNCLTSRFMQDVNKRQQFYFIFPKLRYSPLESTPEKFPNAWQIKWNRIRGMTFEAAQIHFLSDVFAAVAVVVA